MAPVVLCWTLIFSLEDVSGIASIEQLDDARFSLGSFFVDGDYGLFT